MVLTDNSTVCGMFSRNMHADGREYSLLLVTLHIMQGGALNGQSPKHMHSWYGSLPIGPLSSLNSHGVRIVTHTSWRMHCHTHLMVYALSHTPHGVRIVTHTSWRTHCHTHLTSW